MLSFDYRMSTIDVDALFNNDEKTKTAIVNTAKKLNLPDNWLNDDFVNTPSYSEKLKSKAKVYSTFSNIVKVYLLEPKYLIAMKLKSSRPTGGDLDDIIKMIYEMRYKKIPITYEEVLEAYKELYNDFSNTYGYFLEKAKAAFDSPVEDFAYLFE